MSQMKIAPAQMKALSADVDRRFSARLVRHLIKVLAPFETPEAVPSTSLEETEAQWRTLTRRALDFADTHGFIHDDELALVVVIHVAARKYPAVEEMLKPWAAEVLERDESSPLTRLVWIEHQVAELAGDDALAQQLQLALQCTREAFG